ncbi:protein LITTLE ZIPPER 3-like [Neltuma alba]|uniref:protein LITTLE ZIPPER 3-like n=1 Tax=Neltuma alba TaxID=207710 RepID=UPI0010A41DB4|nr:protein LITTLE ZIPPER 3-like [Prosopis alba]
MCTSSSSPDESLCSTFGRSWPLPIKRHKLLHLRLLKRLKEGRERKKKVVVKVKSEIEMKNLRLFMENQSIIEENERLRKKALLLHEENQALWCQLQIKLSQQSRTTTNLINPN